MYVGVHEETPGAMARWIAGMFGTLKSGRYPRVAMISWFNSLDFRTRLDTTPDATRAFQVGAADPIYAAKPAFSGNCLPAKPGAVRTRRVGRKVHVRWAVVPNAAAYEIWRGRRRIAVTTSTSFTSAPAAYRVRGKNPLGVGPFAFAR